MFCVLTLKISRVLLTSIGYVGVAMGDETGAWFIVHMICVYNSCEENFGGHDNVVLPTFSACPSTVILASGNSAWIFHKFRGSWRIFRACAVCQWLMDLSSCFGGGSSHVEGIVQGFELSNYAKDAQLCLFWAPRNYHRNYQRNLLLYLWFFQDFYFSYQVVNIHFLD